MRASPESATNTFRDRGYCRILLANGCSDRRGNCRHFADDGVNLPDCLQGIVGCGLDRTDLFGDLFGGPCGLARQGFHLDCNNGKPFAGFAGTRCFNGRVECE
jgi:hypothetical protein